MVCNGATRDARWRIGWVAFAASVVVMVVAEDGIRLYYSLEDRRLSWALIRRS